MEDHLKAAIITLHNVCNYGTQLQAYATQEKLKQYFDEITFINFKRNDTYGKGLIQTFTKGNIFKALPILPTLIKWKQVFGGFQKEYLNISKKEYLSEADFADFKDEYDIYFCGSDQVWNCGWNKGVIPPYYLSFAPENKPKYAYSSSFGQSHVEEDNIHKSQKYIDRFSYITVRENSGIKILKEQYNYQNVSRVLDPTLIMSPDFWRSKAPKCKIDTPYILIYNLQKNPDLDKFALKIQSKTGYDLYRFCTRYDQIIRPGKSLLIPDVLEFITLIDNAELVITDSFHATAFSMNLNTEPICIYPKEYSGRISDFLKLIGEGKRHIKDYNDIDILNRHVDFDKVNQVLCTERIRSISIIEEKFNLTRR